ncbi:Asp-tRNA(Asn)/Glu-tRNA(Gln) amidotransferase subunit GatA [Thermoflavimicrobium daqui]|jgi:aspartyl-tRNA(Asn)/glutamyl-tRNA(Gln) amidotransferase subunit A|uniref:Glutamyl-tRNA(Gln) amidotransferase subunit A n=1 Tax=Thermoflavimicrobium daqui TaxID=2137476 RepID=A0A364K4S8_9BACL|nr:Asp-tRNA(Asn)/Glu-tRNA(Gln) amidotransferase subunit GatA [Thermoflavimicrobium daqui]RAL24363.1 Asp-tRNA(Asn)/Glu-tRNA(Gln) amidotransferase GatCAB subunit A [Thermoflavimicrobium daqui]
MSLLRLSLKEIHNRILKRELSARDLVEESLKRIEEVDGQVRAFLSIDAEGARKRANKLDQELKEGKSSGLLTAIPVGLKDNLSTEGMTTTCGSQLLANYQPIYNATVVEKLSAVQTISIGKTNMDEFAMGSSNENSGFYPTHNPWDLERVPGGSSGGSAAAVAAGEVYFSLGSDTGGSIRQPASFCGVVGLKPTYGRVSRYGLVAFASSLDQIGPLTKNVEDAAYVLQAISGYDPKDSTSANVEVPDFLSHLTGDIKGLKVAVPKEMLGEGIDPGIREQVKRALAKLEDLGAFIEEVSLPHVDYAVATYYLIAPAEASSNLARYDGVRYGMRKEGRNLLDLYLETRSQGFGSEVKRRIMLGTYALSSGYYDAYYLKAQKVRTLIRNDFEQVFANYDVIVGPTAPTIAFKMGENIDNPLTMYLNDILTIPVNLAGLPSISIPCGLSEGMPVGLQIIGRAFDEATVLRVAHAFEQASEHLPEPQVGGIRV